MKVSEIINFYDITLLYKQIVSNQLCFPKHHIWCYDKFLENGIEVNNVWTSKKINILSPFSLKNIIQQIKCIINSNDSNVIFAPFLFDAYFIAFLKAIKLYNKPLIAIAQDTWNPHYESSYKRKILLKFLRWIAKNGVDKLLFISENVYNKCSYYFNNPKQSWYLNHWGVDLEYFDNFINTTSTCFDYFYMTGGSNRDIDILIQVAEYIPNCQILIQTKKIKNQYSIKTDNLKIDTTPKNESDLLYGYNSASAVLVPLKRDTGSMTGITVVLEGLAFAKPIISTRSTYYPFDLEKEGCGIYVDYEDVKGWVDAILYIKNHPLEAKEMGLRGRKLLETRFNYELFSHEILTYVNLFECKV